MQPERVEKVKSLLASALSKPPAEREAFLNNACSGDPSLRLDIDRYLSKGDETQRFFYHANTVPNVQISQESPSAQATVQIPADPRIGQQFGKYIVRNRVAEGGMGIVYTALDTQLGREVALKILPEYFSRDRERLSRFHREARATSLLNHPNIVTVFEIGQFENCEYIVTEFIEGQTLRDLIRRGNIPFVEMLKIALQVAGALSAAHKAGIIHRDIKPENVMIRPDGYVKVLDFGLAKLTDATQRTSSGGFDIAPSGISHTVPGMIMGTVSYMSPEQAEGMETDARTDIWALGVMLYEMVSGKLPFKGPTPSHTIVAILEQEPPPLENAPPEMKQIITTALQKDRELRYQNAEAMSRALDELKHRLGYISDKNITGPAPTARSIAAVRERPAPSPYRKLLWLVPAAFVLLLIGSVGIYAVVSWLIDSRSDNPGFLPAANSATPIPEETIVPLPTPAATAPEADPASIYVEPIPPEQDPPGGSSESENGPVTPTSPRRPPVRPTPRPQPRRTPVKKPKPTQDPNCVFTNTCK
ncbi:MAG: serine/threonine protein kinase [Chloracidobacterium sp.]|nr:serine/threonine protein kinase [Chloracidobacterium sp.]